MNKNYDFIIIGQGIAGSVLSWYLLERNLKFLVVNDPKKNSSSTAALGVYNPITGKKFVETWNAKKIIKTVEDFYPKIEKKLGEKFFYKRNIYRPFINNKMINDWQIRLESKNYNKYIRILDFKSRHNIIHDHLVGITTKKSGYLNDLFELSNK